MFPFFHYFTGIEKFVYKPKLCAGTSKCVAVMISGIPSLQKLYHSPVTGNTYCISTGRSVKLPTTQVVYHQQFPNGYSVRHSNHYQKPSIP